MKSTTLAALAVVMASPAAAQWIHQEHGSAFDSQKTQLSMAISGQYAVGLRCSNDADLVAIFMTPEPVEDDIVQLMNLSGPELLVRVDENEPYVFAAQAEVPKGSLAIMADAPIELANELIEATSTISVATRMLGDLFHETAFSASGSTASVTKLADGCNLTLD